MTLVKIETEEQFNELIKEESFLLFKHSLTCPVSAEAFIEYQRYVDEHKDVKTAYLAVQEARPLSAYITETFDVKHQSPQAIYFKAGKPAWNESHGRITVDSLIEAAEKL